MIVTSALASLLNFKILVLSTMAGATFPRIFCLFSVVLIIATLLHFIVVSIKPPLVVCRYRFSVSIDFIVIIVSLGNTSAALPSASWDS